MLPAARPFLFYFFSASRIPVKRHASHVRVFISFRFFFLCSYFSSPVISSFREKCFSFDPRSAHDFLCGFPSSVIKHIVCERYLKSIRTIYFNHDALFVFICQISFRGNSFLFFDNKRIGFFNFFRNFLLASERVLNEMAKKIKKTFFFLRFPFFFYIYIRIILGLGRIIAIAIIFPRPLNSLQNRIRTSLNPKIFNAYFFFFYNFRYIFVEFCLAINISKTVYAVFQRGIRVILRFRNVYLYIYVYSMKIEKYHIM